MWYRTSALGVATLPKFAEEIIEAVNNSFEPISFTGDKCPSCKSSLQYLGDIRQQEFLESRKKYENSYRSLGSSEEEIQNALKQFDHNMSDLKSTKFCQQCGSSTNKFLSQINFPAINNWFYKWSLDLPDRIRDEPSLLGNFMKNTKLNLEEKIFEVNKNLQMLRFIKELNPDNFGSYSWATNELGLKNNVVNSEKKAWMLQTLRHELGHLFSLDKEHQTTNTIYERDKTENLFDKVMLDHNIQLNSLEELKGLQIEALVPSVKKYKEQIFPGYKFEPGLDELLARLSKSLLVNSKIDLLYGNGDSNHYAKQYSYYVYMTSEVETPTMLSDLIYIFNEENLENYRLKNFRNISKNSYCNYLKETIRSWNPDKITGFVESVTSFDANPNQKYSSLLYTLKLDDRPRIKKFIIQLQKNLVMQVNNYCNNLQENRREQE